MNPQAILPYLQLVTSVATICMLAFGFYKFLNKPRNVMNEEINRLKENQIKQDLEIKELKKSLNACFDKHREQDNTNAVFKKVFLLFANFEIAFCLHTGYEHTEDLKEAKKELDEYLTSNHDK